MNSRVSLQPAYILHSRPYRDSSQLLEAFTPEYGRISLATRGSRRRTRGGSAAALLQPFVPLLLSFSGRGELKSLVATEAVGSAPALRGERLFSGLYLNELLMRLLHRHDPHPQLFSAYSETLAELLIADPMELVLRHFELTLLTELGYSFDMAVDYHTGETVQEDAWYRYDPGQGLTALKPGQPFTSSAFSGEDLLGIARGDFSAAARRACKRLLREALAEHLGEAPLRSRDLFQSAVANRGPDSGPKQEEGL
tara:strand:+ start:1862 stop:2623 length:762 start_codon:yes stop_codon:yes gene_type:complete